VLEGAGRGALDVGPEPRGVVAGQDDSMGAERLGRPQEIPQVAGVLDLIQSQKQCRLAPAAWNGEEVVEGRVGPRGDPRHHPLVVGGPRQGREGGAGSAHAAHPGLAGQGDEGPEPGGLLALDQDLVDAAGPAPEGLQHRVAPVEN
jgi:hypothetical protein